MTTPALRTDPYESSPQTYVTNVVGWEAASWYAPEWWVTHRRLSGLVDNMTARMQGAWTRGLTALVRRRSYAPQRGFTASTVMCLITASGHRGRPRRGTLTGTRTVRRAELAGRVPQDLSATHRRYWVAVRRDGGDKRRERTLPGTRRYDAAPLRQQHQRS